MTSWLMVAGIAMVAGFAVSRAGSWWAHRAARGGQVTSSIAPAVGNLPAEHVCHVMRHARAGANVSDPGSPLAAFLLRQVLAGNVVAVRERLTAAQLVAEEPRAQSPTAATMRIVGWISRMTGPVEMLTLRRRGPAGSDEATVARVFTEGPAVRRIRNAAGDDDLRSAGQALEGQIEAEARRWGIWPDRPVGRFVLRTSGGASLLVGVLAVGVGVWGGDWLPWGVAAGALLGAAGGALMIREPRPPALESFCRAVEAELGQQLRRLEWLCTGEVDPDDEEEVLEGRVREVMAGVTLLHAVHPNMGSPQWAQPTGWLNHAARHDMVLRDALARCGWAAEDYPDVIDWIYFLTSRIRKAQELDSD